MAKRAASKSAKNTGAGRRSVNKRKKLTPRKDKVGLDAGDISLDLHAASVVELVRAVTRAGGAALAAYREPLAGQAIVLAALPLQKIQPTPFQRDLSPTHTKRLAEKIAESGCFLDPLIAVAGDNAQFWTPNGRHRLAAAKLLGLKQVTVLLAADATLAFRILALNTEKAHNLKDRSLEVIRMARELAQRHPRARESDYQAQFEAAEFLTLGILYEDHGRFSGSAYSPFLKRVDCFSDRTLAASLRQREGHAARLLAIDDLVKDLVGQLQKRGFKSPYLKNYVVARINPVRWLRRGKGETEPVMTLAAALTRMLAAARKFDIGSVNPGELAMVSALLP